MAVTIRSTHCAVVNNPILHANFVALCFTEPESRVIADCGNGDFQPFCFCDLDLTRWPYTNLTRILSRYTGCARMNFLRQGFRKLSSDRQTDRQTCRLHEYRHDRNYTASRVVKDELSRVNRQKLFESGNAAIYASVSDGCEWQIPREGEGHNFSDITRRNRDATVTHHWYRSANFMPDWSYSVMTRLQSHRLHLLQRLEIVNAANDRLFELVHCIMS